MASLFEKYGPWALVTGATSGVGTEYVHQLAEAKFNIVLVARRHEVSVRIAAEVEKKYGVSTRVIDADLSKEEDCEKILKETNDIDIGLLVNNAGIEFNGNYLYSDFKQHSKLITVNVTAVSLLAHEFGRRFVQRGKGAILFMSSLVKDVFPWMGSYSASKAFVSNLAYAMNFELKENNVDVLSVEPGVIDTPMADTGDFKQLGFPAISAKECASAAIAALSEGKLRLTPGQPNDEKADQALFERLEEISKAMKTQWDPKIFKAGHPSV